jgi:hypothetical protein
LRILRRRHVESDAGSPPTRRESYVIAGMALVLSTAFWATISRAIEALWKATRRECEPPNQPLPPTSGTTGLDGSHNR